MDRKTKNCRVSMQFDHYFADFAKSKAKEPIIENGR
jgi:hypothetical protein